MSTDFCVLSSALIRSDSQTANKSDFPYRQHLVHTKTCVPALIIPNQELGQALSTWPEPTAGVNMHHFISHMSVISTDKTRKHLNESMNWGQL